jgi:hypothetical protein
MKTIAYLPFLTASTLEAAQFQNLNFESANTNGLTVVNGDLQGRPDQLIPSWSVGAGATPLTSVLYNARNLPFLESGGPNIFDRFYSVPTLGGSFTLQLYQQGGGPLFIEQQAEIPSGAVALVYTYQGLPFMPSIDGVDLPPPLQIFAETPSTVAVDVTSFSERSGTLRFTAARDVFGNFPGKHDIDNIAFLVPEPSHLQLALLGGAVFGILAVAKRVRRSRAKC